MTLCWKITNNTTGEIIEFPWYSIRVLIGYTADAIEWGYKLGYSLSWGYDF